jgi:hypothetical protein
MGDEITKFAEEIGAISLRHVLRVGKFRKLFKNDNYFRLNNDTFLIIKISRLGSSFWGVGKKFVDFFDNLTEDNENYYFIVCLMSNNEGYFLSKDRWNNLIENKSISYSESQGEYKIRSNNLSDSDSFSSPKSFLDKIERVLARVRKDNIP